MTLRWCRNDHRKNHRTDKLEALFLLIPLSVILVFIAIWVFFGASDSGQFDDLVGPGLRILQDNDRTEDSEQTGQK